MINHYNCSDKKGIEVLVETGIHVISISTYVSGYLPVTSLIAACRCGQERTFRSAYTGRLLVSCNSNEYG